MCRNQHKILLFLTILLFLNCNYDTPQKFSKVAVNEEVIAIDGTKTDFNTILQRYKGNTVFIDFWASWCGDCVRSFPEIKKLQEKHKNIIFLFLSVDENLVSWKSGIRRFNLDGEHYNLPKGMKDGDLVDFVGLSWIPRYMIINKNGEIEVFKATKTDDDVLLKTLEKTI